LRLHLTIEEKTKLEDKSAQNQVQPIQQEMVILSAVLLVGCL
jgi:hypothetical protein